MVSVPRLCPLDGYPDTEEHNLLQANADILFLLKAWRPRPRWLRWLRRTGDLDDPQRGALLHAQDELQGLADKLGIEGFQHFDD